MLDDSMIRMEGKIDLVLSKLGDIKEDNRAIRANQWVIGGTILLAIFGTALGAEGHFPPGAC
jgi:hypothetical protein